MFLNQVLVIGLERSSSLQENLSLSQNRLQLSFLEGVLFQLDTPESGHIFFLSSLFQSRYFCPKV